MDFKDSSQHLRISPTGKPGEASFSERKVEGKNRKPPKSRKKFKEVLARDPKGKEGKNLTKKAPPKKQEEESANVFDLASSRGSTKRKERSLAEADVALPMEEQEAAPKKKSSLSSPKLSSSVAKPQPNEPTSEEPILKMHKAIADRAPVGPTSLITTEQPEKPTEEKSASPLSSLVQDAPLPKKRKEAVTATTSRSSEPTNTTTHILAELPPPTAATQTEANVQTLTPKNLQLLVDQLVQTARTVEQEGITETKLVLKHPILEGVTVKITQSETAPGQLNLAFHNLTQQAKALMDQPVNLHNLKEGLQDKGLTVHILITSTREEQTTTTKSSELSDSTLYREKDEEEEEQEEKKR